MKPIYHHYKDWEDWQNGMYSPSKLNWETKVNDSIKILTSSNLHKKMTKVCNEWINSTEENLSDISINARPWIGRAVCCYYCKATENIVREAWFKLTADQMKYANDIADMVIKEWRDNYGDVQLELDLCLK